MKLFCVAGEASGDLHGARLLAALRERVPSLELKGIGGARMQREGLRSLVSQESMSVVGFAEVAKRYGFFRRTLRSCAHEMREWKADALLAIDYPGFNTRLAAEARKAGIPVLWYIAPQFWAWGAGRARSFAKVVDELMVVFPFEVDFFGGFGIRAEFVGHPLLDDEAFDQVLLPPSERPKNIAFLPGSRLQEIQRHLPLYLDVAHRLRESFSDHRFILARAPQLSDDQLASVLHDDSLFELETDSRAAMRSARAGLIKTGTSTLEASLCGLPHCMMYKTSTLSYRIARGLVRLPYISLTNILSQKMLVREFIQSEARPDAISAELTRLLRDTRAADELYAQCLELRHQLGDRGAAQRAAEHILKSLGRLSP